MVLEGRGRGAIPSGPDRKESTKTISSLLYSALTIRPVQRESLNNSYWTALLFGVLLTVAMVASLMLGVCIKVGPSVVADNKEVFVANFLGRLFILMVGCWIASYLNCMVVGASHSAKEYLIFLSAMVYIPVLLPLGFLFTLVFSIGTFALVLLNAFYLNSSYSPMLPYEDTRLSIIHHVYIVVALYMLYSLLLYPSAFTK